VHTFEFDFHHFSLSDSTSVFDNIQHYPYLFSVELFKKLYLFFITNIINFYNKVIRGLYLLVNILILSIYG
jgi:hypothetical protein